MAKHYIILNMSSCGMQSFSLPNRVMWLTLNRDRATGVLDFVLLGICAAMIWYQWGLQDNFHYPCSLIKPGLLWSSHPSSGTEQSRDTSPPQDHYRTLLQFVPGCAQIMEINNPLAKLLPEKRVLHAWKPWEVSKESTSEWASHPHSAKGSFFFNPGTLPCPMPHIQT